MELLMGKLLLLLLPLNLWAGNHPIYDQILKNRPNIDKKYAMELSNEIYKVSKEYDIPKNIYTAIIAQESGYNIDAKGSCHTGYAKVLPCEREEKLNMCIDMLWQNPVFDVQDCKNEANKIWVKTELCKDFGLSQVNSWNIKKYNLDVDRLLNDMYYSLKWGAHILSGFKKRYAAKDPDWWTRFNCGSRGTTKRQTCQNYKRKVSRYL